MYEHRDHEEFMGMDGSSMRIEEIGMTIDNMSGMRRWELTSYFT